jgi:hypothetical protein
LAIWQLPSTVTQWCQGLTTLFSSVRLAAALRTAAEPGDTRTLQRLLVEDAVLYTDGGGKRPAALTPIHRILRLLLTRAAEAGDIAEQP